MTPGEAWEKYIGSQSCEEFMRHFGHGDKERAVEVFVDGMAPDFRPQDDSDYDLKRLLLRNLEN
jgi:hypothetical protein